MFKFSFHRNGWFFLEKKTIYNWLEGPSLPFPLSKVIETTAG